MTDHFVYAKILDPIGPMDRGDKYEDPLQEQLQEAGLGEVTGGGTQLGEGRSIEFCGVDISLNDLETGLPFVADALAKLGAPAGSVLEYERDGELGEYPIQ